MGDADCSLVALQGEVGVVLELGDRNAGNRHEEVTLFLGLRIAGDCRDDVVWRSAWFFFLLCSVFLGCKSESVQTQQSFSLPPMRA